MCDRPHFFHFFPRWGGLREQFTGVCSGGCVGGAGFAFGCTRSFQKIEPFAPVGLGQADQPEIGNDKIVNLARARGGREITHSMGLETQKIDRDLVLRTPLVHLVLFDSNLDSINRMRPHIFTQYPARGWKFEECAVKFLPRQFRFQDSSRECSQMTKILGFHCSGLYHD
jgi:hypothetical protein